MALVDNLQTGFSRRGLLKGVVAGAAAAAAEAAAWKPARADSPARTISRS